MTPDRAREILEFPLMERGAIRRAFAKVLSTAHPDVAAPRAGFTFTEIIDARECLLSLLLAGENTCKLCGGRGSISGRACAQCAGLGVK